MIDLSPLRLWLESLHPGAPWVALVPALVLVARVLSDARIQALFGERHRAIVISIVTILGALWPDLSSGDQDGMSMLLGGILGIVAALQSPKPPDDGAPADDAPTGMRKLTVSLILLLVSCAPEPRPPGRDPCYIAADAEAARRYWQECADYEDTRECPAGAAIEADHQAAQEACP